MLAPVAPGITCVSDTTPGCRFLSLIWDSGTPRRLSEVKFFAPASELPVDGSGKQWVSVAKYEYDATAARRLIAAWDPRISPALKTQYAYDGANRLTSVTPPGENAWDMTYQSISGDVDTGRLKDASRLTPQAPPAAPAQAKETVQFAVPLAGGSAPYNMSPTALATWGQTLDAPTDAAALFRPDDVPASNPASSYAKATVMYLDGLGRLTNVARPGGEISTSQHDAAGNVIRELTAANRAQALASTNPAPADLAGQIDTKRIYDEEFEGEGWRLRHEYGPAHQVKLDNGTVATARKHTAITYDEGRADSSKTYNLPTTTTVTARVGDLPPGTGTDHDARVTKNEYDWTLKLPTKTRVDPTGEDITTVTVYDSGGQGLVVRQRMPRSPNSDDASTRRTIYYTAGTNSEDSACGSKPQWANRPCKIFAAGTTTGTNTPTALPVTVFEYDAYGHVTQASQYVSSTERRRTVSTYEGDRVKTVHITSPTSTGTALPKVVHSYSSTTGRLTSKQFDTSPQRTVSTGYDAVGRQTSHTDAEGAQTTTSYDLLGRVASVTSPAAARAMSYNATTGRLSQLTDDDLGTIDASYDQDGILTGQHFGTANIDLIETVDESGAVTTREYSSASPCTTNCGRLKSEALSSIHGQWRCDSLSRTGATAMCNSPAGAIRNYSYDSVGRLTKTEDQRDSAQCVTRTYDFVIGAGPTKDKNSNRRHAKTFAPAGNGSCATTTTTATQSLVYDEADQLDTSGTVIDALGRTTTVPAVDAGGSTFTASYYVNDLAHTLQQSGSTTTLDLDAAMRVRGRTTPPASAEINHYSDDSDSPAWTEQGTAIRRNIPGIDGQLIAARGADGRVTIELSDLHGDLVGELDNSLGAGPTSLPGTDEFGVPRQVTPQPITVVATAKTLMGSNGTTLSLAKPAGIQSGDLLVAQVLGGNSATATPPAGWTAIPGASVVGGTGRYQLYYRIAGAGEPASYAFTLNASTRHMGAITALRNTATTEPISAVATGSGNTTNITAPSVTPPEADSAIIAFGGNDLGDLNGGSALGFPAGYTEQWESTTGPLPTDRTGGGAAKVLTGGANTATGTITIANQTGYTNDYWGAVTIAIRPVQPAGAYGYLGAHQRHTSTQTGIIEMGARLYNPTTGRFLQTDPVYGGSANNYDYTSQDPVNAVDLDGRQKKINGHCYDYIDNSWKRVAMSSCAKRRQGVNLYGVYTLLTPCVAGYGDCGDKLYRRVKACVGGSGIVNVVGFFTAIFSQKWGEGFRSGFKGVVRGVVAGCFVGIGYSMIKDSGGNH